MKQNSALVDDLPTWVQADSEWILPFEAAELERRRDGLLQAMNDEGVEVVVITTSRSLIYLTGNQAGGPEAFNRLVIAADGTHRFILRRIDLGWKAVWRPQTWVKDWFDYEDGEGIDSATVRAIREVGGKPEGTLGLELDRPSLSYESAVSLGSGSNMGLTNATRMVESLRVIKSPAEIEVIRSVAPTSLRANEALVEALRAGATDVEAAIAAQTVIMREGGGHTHNQPYVFSGPAGEMGHMCWARVAPKPGETTSWYISGVRHNYSNPIERTLLRNPDTDGVQRMLDSVEAATEAVVSGIRPGMTSQDAYALAYRVHEKFGYERYFLNNAAYSTGIHWNEFDLFRLRPHDERTLEVGMTLHVVPMLIVPGVGNVCASRFVVVSEDGSELLNDAPLRLEAFD